MARRGPAGRPAAWRCLAAADDTDALGLRVMGIADLPDYRCSSADRRDAIGSEFDAVVPPVPRAMKLPAPSPAMIAATPMAHR